MNKAIEQKGELPLVGLIYKSNDGEIKAWHSRLAGEVKLQPRLFALPPGIWFTDEVGTNELMFEPAPNHYLVTEHWLGISIREIAGEWGINPATHSEFQRLICLILQRILLLIGLLCMSRDNKGQSGQGLLDDIYQLVARPSLYKAINQHTCQGKMQGTAPRAMEDLTLFGSFGNGLLPKSGTMLPIMRASYPSYSYMSKLARLPIPCQGRWKQSKLVEKYTALTRDHENELGLRKVPVIICGKFNPSNNLNPPWVNEWIYGAGNFGRTAFTLNEVKILRVYGTVLVEKILVGTGWVKPTSSNSTLVRNLVRLVRLYGGTELVKSSWTAEFVSQALFHGIAVYDSIQNRSKHPKLAWLAAEDRIRMLPIIKMLHATNLPIVSAIGGVVRFYTPMEDWDQAQLRREFSAMGVTLTSAPAQPADASSVFARASPGWGRGSSGQERLQFLMHNGLGKWLWRYDTILGLPPEERAGRLAELNSRFDHHYA